MKKFLPAAIGFVICVAAAYWLGRTNSPVLAGTLRSITVQSPPGSQLKVAYHIQEGDIKIYSEFVVITHRDGTRQIEPLANVSGIKLKE